MITDDLKRFVGGGMDSDSAPEDVAPNDYISATNMRSSGTSGQDANYLTNIEGTQAIPGSLLPGINNIIGGEKFDDTGQILGFRFNSGGKCQMVLYTAATNTYQVIYEDLTNSGGIPLLPLNPQNWVKCILINKTYAVWWAKGLEVGYTNLKTLASGGYGTVLAEDLSLLKPQCMIPPTGVYGSDAGQPTNYLYGKLPQFITQFVNADFNYSAWSTRSKRIVPYQQNTPALGADVTKNNYIIVTTDIGSIRASVINIACQFDDEGKYSIIKSVNRSYVTALPNTSVNIATEVYEAYNPATNTYSFAFYNNTVAIPVTPTETDLFYDYIWPSNAGALINGNLIALGDFNTLYARPATSSTFSAAGHDPNIGIPAGTYSNSLIKIGQFNGASGSGAGNHRRNMWVAMSGSPRTGDIIVIVTADIRNATATRDYSYTVPASQNGNLLSVVQSLAGKVGGSYASYGTGYKISWTDIPYYGIQIYNITLAFAGATVSNSVPTFLDNTSYQAAWAYFDAKGRPFPIDTDNTFIFTTPSSAQVRGNAIGLSWQINGSPPLGATSYQLMITKAPVTKLIDTIATPLVYKGAWDAKSNTLGLSATTGTEGDTYQITTPCNSVDTAHYTNLGAGESYDTGNYITKQGKAWIVLQKAFGDLTTTGNILAFSLNSLKIFNDTYANQGVSTIIGYDYATGDRCTLHYYLDGSGNKIYINNPCVDLSILGYDAGSYIVKVEKSATFDTSVLTGKNVFLRLYSPGKQSQSTSTTQNGTVWYEIGERFTITNGNHDVTNGTTYDGGVYYKTRQFASAVSPYGLPPIQTLSYDLNYSDFYPSPYYSFGRDRTYYDVLEQTEQSASIITTETYISGSKNNGLNRAYPANIYGDGDGQTSSSEGAIQILDQRGDVLIVVQERNTFYAPVNTAYQVLNPELTGIAISEKLLNNGRYDTMGIGIGLAKESYCKRYSTRYMIDPNKSLPYELTTGGIIPISGKMTKYFKGIIQLAYSQGKKLHMFYNDFYEEVVLAIQADRGILTFFPFSADNWNTLNNYIITGGQVSATPNGANCTASYNSSTGVVTYTPNPNFVGNDTPTFTFNPGSGNITLNNCLNWTAGVTTVSPFGFSPVTGQPLSTNVQSNSITVSGPNIAVSISITGGQYSINGGAFTSSAGTVNANDVVIVQLTTSGTAGTAASATLTIGATSSTFTATTITTTANHFTLSANYNVTIVSVANGSATGVPGAFGTANLAPGSNMAAAYTTLTAGTIQVTTSGSPGIPGHIRIYLSVAGTEVATATMVLGQSVYNLTLPTTQTDPTLIQIGIESF